jgi:hypothetical protein
MSEMQDDIPLLESQAFPRSRRRPHKVAPPLQSSAKIKARSSASCFLSLSLLPPRAPWMTLVLRSCSCTTNESQTPPTASQ